jgi:hypothetical protein
MVDCPPHNGMLLYLSVVEKMIWATGPRVAVEKQPVLAIIF